MPRDGRKSAEVLAEELAESALRAAMLLETAEGEEAWESLIRVERVLRAARDSLEPERAREAGRRASRRYAARIRQERREAGLCLDCGRPAQGGARLCEACRKTRAERERRRRERSE